jgi:hypothetical protein
MSKIENLAKLVAKKEIKDCHQMQKSKCNDTNR